MYAVLGIAAVIALVMLMKYSGGYKRVEAPEGDPKEEEQEEPQKTKADEPKQVEEETEQKQRESKPKPVAKPEPTTYLPSGNQAGEVSLGDQSEDVAQLQENLNTWGAGLKVNGIFDKRTKEAVEDVTGIETDSLDLADCPAMEAEEQE